MLAECLIFVGIAQRLAQRFGAIDAAEWQFSSWEDVFDAMRQTSEGRSLGLANIGPAQLRALGTHGIQQPTRVQDGQLVGTERMIGAAADRSRHGLPVTGAAGPLTVARPMRSVAHMQAEGHDRHDGVGIPVSHISQACRDRVEVRGHVRPGPRAPGVAQEPPLPVSVELARVELAPWGSRGRSEHQSTLVE